MHPYTFRVSLRANHPSSDLFFLSELFGLNRRHGWTVGDDRVTSKGTPLGGVRNESYWSAHVTEDETSSEEWQLEDILERSVTEVLDRGPKLFEFFSTGGTLNYFIGLYGTRNYGLNFSPELMSKLARAKIELQLDVYP